MGVEQLALFGTPVNLPLPVEEDGSVDPYLELGYGTERPEIPLSRVLHEVKKNVDNGIKSEETISLSKDSFMVRGALLNEYRAAQKIIHLVAKESGPEILKSSNFITISDRYAKNLISLGYTYAQVKTIKAHIRVLWTTLDLRRRKVQMWKILFRRKLKKIMQTEK